MLLILTLLIQKIDGQDILGSQEDTMFTLNAKIGRIVLITKASVDDAELECVSDDDIHFVFPYPRGKITLRETFRLRKHFQLDLDMEDTNCNKIHL
ncbi:hypothetical protein JHK87_001918 [Glycine soja]|nr:hypothetical protein JHK87_001918 [Glycine soja]